MARNRVPIEPPFEIHPALNPIAAATTNGTSGSFLHAEPQFETFSRPVLAPIAFARFCYRYPEDCKVRSSDHDQTPVPLTQSRLSQLSKINYEVNNSITPQENTEGVLRETWLVAPNQGDCNDYAVTKRHELLSLGWPSRSLLLAEVVVRSGEHHLVLLVRTRQADLVLDNLNPEIRTVAQSEYKFVRTQQGTNPKFWSATTNVAGVDRLALNGRQ